MVFTFMNIYVIGKNEMKFNYLKKKLFTVTQTGKILLMQSTSMQKDKNFEIKFFGKYDLYVQSDALLSVDVFGNFWNMYLEIYELDPARFLSKTSKSKTRYINWYQYVINGRKKYQEEYVTLFIDMQKLLTSR